MRAGTLTPYPSLAPSSDVRRVHHLCVCVCACVCACMCACLCVRVRLCMCGFCAPQFARMAAPASAVWNPTADLLRLIWSMQRSLLIAYGFSKAESWQDGGAAGGQLTLDALGEAPGLSALPLIGQLMAALPLASHISGWLEHVKKPFETKVLTRASPSQSPSQSPSHSPLHSPSHSPSPEATFLVRSNSVSFKVPHADDGMPPMTPTALRYETLIDFLCAGVEAKNNLLGPYYRSASPAAWFSRLMPAQILADCPLSDAPSTPDSRRSASPRRAWRAEAVTPDTVLGGKRRAALRGLSPFGRRPSNAPAPAVAV